MKNKQQYFVTGIGTDVGKTVVSAILLKALDAEYWKPVQAGTEPRTDSIFVEHLTGGVKKIYPEQYCLQTPMSPHAAAERENVLIRLDKFVLPETEQPLIVEGAGGLFVPLNYEYTIIDLIGQLQLPVILVSRHYLGSINHTLSSVEALRRRNISIRLLVFIGDHPESESVILKMTGIKQHIKIPEVESITHEWIEEQASKMKTILTK